jgi:hypothetical protein
MGQLPSLTGWEMPTPEKKVLILILFIQEKP